MFKNIFICFDDENVEDLNETKPPSKICNFERDSNPIRFVRIPRFRNWMCFYWRKGMDKFSVIFHSDGYKLLYFNKVRLQSSRIISED